MKHRIKSEREQYYRDELQVEIQEVLAKVGDHEVRVSLDTFNDCVAIITNADKTRCYSLNCEALTEHNFINNIQSAAKYLDSLPIYEVE